MALRTTQSRRADYPAPVDVHIGAEWLPATAHAERVGRQGRQILITQHGHLIWVAAHRVRRHDDVTAIAPRLPSARTEPA